MLNTISVLNMFFCLAAGEDISQENYISYILGGKRIEIKNPLSLVSIGWILTAHSGALQH